MNLWVYFWGAVILFSIVSFTYMSIKVIYKGLAELKEMFESLSQLRRIRHKALDLASIGNWTIINANKSSKSTENKIWEYLKRKYET